MAISLSSPVTGAAQTGFTTPSYTVALSGNPPEINAKEYVVTALGGTQANVAVHSVTRPNKWTWWVPKVFRFLGKPHPVTGLVSSFPRNTFSAVTTKGVLVLAGQPYQNMVVKTIIDVPAGAETADPENVRAALSLHIGALSQVSAGVGDTTITGYA